MIPDDTSHDIHDVSEPRTRGDDPFTAVSLLLFFK